MIRRILAFIGILLVEHDRPATPPSRPAALRPRWPVRPDPSPAELAAIQSAAPVWLVMWCWYRREFVAFARFGTASTIIYDDDSGRLLQRCREAEYAAMAPGQVVLA